MIRLIENVFTKPMPEVATIPRENPNALVSAVESYRDAEKAWDLAKKNLLRYRISHPQADAVWMANDAALCHVNVLKNEDPQLTRLCGLERACAAARNEALRGMLRAQGKLF